MDIIQNGLINRLVYLNAIQTDGPIFWNSLSKTMREFLIKAYE